MAMTARLYQLHPADARAGLGIVEAHRGDGSGAKRQVPELVDVGVELLVAAGGLCVGQVARLRS